MISDAMQLAELIRNRRSTAPVTDDAPSDADLRRFVALAAHSPDHASLRRWRLIVLRGHDRQRLGEALVAGFGDEPGSPQAARTAAKPLRAPMLLGIVFAPVEHPKVPEWEQLAATVSMTTTLQLVMYEAGYTAMWRTGPAVELAPVRELHRLVDGERLLGWLYVGATSPGTDGGPSDDPDVSDKISNLPHPR
jgi:nitroreductase